VVNIREAEHLFCYSLKLNLYMTLVKLAVNLLV
jgi:hypothetical protein